MLYDKDGIDKFVHTIYISILKEGMAQLKLAVWKAKLDEKEEDSSLKGQVKSVEIDKGSVRGEKRITSGADIIIKNVLPFLKLQ